MKYELDITARFTTPAEVVDDLVDKGETLINHVAGLGFPYDVDIVEEVSRQVIMMKKVKMARDQHHLHPSKATLGMLSGYLFQSAIQAFFVSHAIDQYLKQENDIND